MSSFNSLLSFFMLAIFIYFQILSVDSPIFLLLTFSSFIFLAIGTILLFSTSAQAQIRRNRIFVNLTALFFIVIVLLAGYSIATISRGGCRHSYLVSPKPFPLTVSYDVGPGIGVYSGSNYPYETIHVADYPVGWAEAISSWNFWLEILTERPITLNGTAYAALVFSSEPGSMYETSFKSIAFANEKSTLVEIRPMFWNWGSYMANNHRVRVEGYRFDLWVSLWLMGQDYGPTINFTVWPHGEVGVSDYVVDSKLQNFAALVLCGAFIGILLLIPAKPLKSKMDPTINRIKQSIALWLKGVEVTPKSFLKNCINCGKEIPIASEECSYCGAKQPE